MSQAPSTSREVLHSALSKACRGLLQGRPPRRGAAWLTDAQARMAAEDAITVLAWCGFTVTDRDGRVVVAGRPPMTVHDRPPARAGARQGL